LTRAKQEFLTPAEAAVVSSVSVRNVNRAIDESILPKGLFEVDAAGNRRILANSCVFLSFYIEAAARLTAEERLRIIVKASEQLADVQISRLEKEWVIRQEFLAVDLAPFLRSVRERLKKLERARALVVEDPEILSGTPVIKGTRVPAFDIAGFVAAGDSIERILENYPSLNVESVELAKIYAEAYPLRGRPRQSRTLPAGAVIVAAYRVPRQSRKLRQAS
jgi:uncharacterized protein (DUF433 family)